MILILLMLVYFIFQDFKLQLEDPTYVKMLEKIQKVISNDAKVQKVCCHLGHFPGFSQHMKFQRLQAIKLETLCIQSIKQSI